MEQRLRPPCWQSAQTLSARGHSSWHCRWCFICKAPTSFSFSHHGLDPVDELADPGVDPGLVRLAAPDAPGEDPRQLVPVLVLLHHHQGPPTVPLTRVLPPVTVAGAEKMVRDVLPVSAPEELRLALLVGHNGQINLLENWGKRTSWEQTAPASYPTNFTWKMPSLISQESPWHWNHHPGPDTLMISILRVRKTNGSDVVSPLHTFIEM